MGETPSMFTFYKWMIWAHTSLGLLVSTNSRRHALGWFDKKASVVKLQKTWGYLAGHQSISIQFVDLWISSMDYINHSISIHINPFHTFIWAILSLWISELLTGLSCYPAPEIPRALRTLKLVMWNSIPVSMGFSRQRVAELCHFSETLLKIGSLPPWVDFWVWKTRPHVAFLS